MQCQIFDKFGENIVVREVEDKYETTVGVQPSKPFYLWIAGTLGKVRIHEPQEVVNEFNDFVGQIKNSS